MNTDSANQFKFEEELTAFEKDFLSFHRIRLKSLLKLLDSEIERNRKAKVLNIGLSVFDLIVKESLYSTKDFDYSVAVPSLDFGKSIIYTGIKLIELDICKPGEMMEKYEGLFDFIIFSGVLEHLFCDDGMVLKNLQVLLKPKGRIFLAVPNAASFINRFRLALGKNIHWNKKDILGGTEFGGYGHIREYTKMEVADLVAPIFNIVKFIPINDYRIRGINFGRFNKLMPVSLSIDIGVLLENK